MLPDDWETGHGKQLESSNHAAWVCDKYYEQERFATFAHLQYEEEALRSAIAQAPHPRRLALDLGCATGRCLALLCPHFERVTGFDFSAQRVQAARSWLAGRFANGDCRVLDVDEQDLPVPPGSCQLILASFGMGSCVRSFERLAAMLHAALVPGGLALFSLYNAQALSRDLRPGGNPALAASLLTGQAALRVRADGASFDMGAIRFALNRVRAMLEDRFRLLSLTTFPRVAGLLQPATLADARARAITFRLDRQVAPRAAGSGPGTCILALGRKLA